MKKILTVLAAALFGGLMLSGCSSDGDNIFTELTKTNTWCKKTVEYTSNATEEGSTGNKTDLYCYFFYSDSIPNFKDLRTDLKVKVNGQLQDYEPAAGLTVVVTCKVEDDTNAYYTALKSSLSGKKPFFIKTFAKGTSTADVESSEDDSPASTLKGIKIGYAAWSAFYLANYSEFEDSSSSLPACLNTENTDVYKQVTDLSSFSWKKMLAYAAIDKLLGE